MKKILFYALLMAFALVGCEKEPESPELTFDVNGVIFKMIRVEGGTFTMGATPEQVDPNEDELPTHKVKLKTYYMGETEVTRALWDAVMDSNSDSVSGPEYPKDNVTWNEANEFIAKLNELTGQEFCLPTEAEWEYAARGGNKSHGYVYSGSDSISEVAWANVVHWYFPPSRKQVKTSKPNELGLYDMSGNVYELCHDWYGPYSDKTQHNPTGPSTGTERVCRGGSIVSSSWQCRVSARRQCAPSYYTFEIGFRIALR